MLPGRSELDRDGINAAYWNATHEGGSRNGVLTAIEDFAKGRGVGWSRSRSRAGTASRSWPEPIASPRLGAELDRLRSAELLHQQLDRIERARIVAGMRASAGTARSAAGDRDYGLLDEPE